MALSEHDQTILAEMETALRAAPTRPNSARRSANRTRSPHSHVAVTIGLLITGTVAMVVGLLLADGLGAGLGVVGFLFIVGSAWSATRLLRPLPRSMRTRNESPAGERR